MLQGKPMVEKESRDNAIVRTFREVRSEMKKVVWPTREETIRLTAVVVALSVVISMILFAADALFATLLTLLQSAVS
jgi:preprotein translocase subunit SecE